MFNFKKHGMKKNYVTTAVALLLLAGCSNDIKETDITGLNTKCGMNDV